MARHRNRGAVKAPKVPTKPCDNPSCDGGFIVVDEETWTVQKCARCKGKTRIPIDIPDAPKPRLPYNDGPDPEQMDMALEDTIDGRFRLFHAENPAVYETLRTLALDARRRGATKISIKMLWEVMRYETGTFAAAAGDDRTRLPNEYHSRYARLLMDQEQELVGIFETRPLRSL